MAFLVVRGSIHHLVLYTFYTIFIRLRTGWFHTAVKLISLLLFDSGILQTHKSYAGLHITNIANPFQHREPAKSFLFAHLCLGLFCRMFRIFWWILVSIMWNVVILLLCWNDVTTSPTWVNSFLVFLRYNHVTACISDHNSSPTAVFWVSMSVVIHFRWHYYHVVHGFVDGRLWLNRAVGLMIAPIAQV